MKDAWVPLLAALAGGLIASLTNLVSLFFNARAERRRELTRLAVQAAVEDHKVLLAWTESRRPRQFAIPPLAYNIQFHWRMLRLLDKGSPSREAIARELRIHRSHRDLYGGTPLPESQSSAPSPEQP